MPALCWMLYRYRMESSQSCRKCYPEINTEGRRAAEDAGGQQWGQDVVASMETPEPKHSPPQLCHPHGLAYRGSPFNEEVQNQKASRGFKPPEEFLIQMPYCGDLVPWSSGPVSHLQALHGRFTDSFGKLLGWEASPWQPLDRHPHPSSLPPGEGWGPSLIWMDSHLFSFMKDRWQRSFPFSFCLRLTELENVHTL